MAQAMVVLLALHLMQVVIDRAYQAPREVNFWLGLVLMLIVLGLALTGYLLPWDQKGYWATRVATNLMNLTDRRLPPLVVGGADYGHQTLTRFFAFHAGVLPLLLTAILVVHVGLFRRHGVCAKEPQRAPDAPFWPDQALKDSVACLAVLAVVVFLIVRPALFGAARLHTPTAELGAELGAPADPTNPYAAARPEWYFLFLFQFLKLFGPRTEFFGAIVVPGLVIGFMFLMLLRRAVEIGACVQHFLSVRSADRRRLADDGRLYRRSSRPLDDARAIRGPVCRRARGAHASATTIGARSTPISTATRPK